MTHQRKRDEEDSLEKEIYFQDSYFAWDQLASQSAQIIQVNKLKPTKVLEIGKGNGFVCDFLGKAGYKVTTIDINKNLEPDIHGSVLELDRHFEEGEFDCVLCAEVLEHLPFSEFDNCVKQIARVTSKNAIITLPRLQKIMIDMPFSLKLPFIKKFTSRIFWPMKAPKSRMYNAHHWEVNSDPHTSLANLRSDLKKHFNLLDDYVEQWNSYHQFFILEKH